MSAASNRAPAPVVIVGAGPAGIAAATTLVAHGLRPVVIDEARAAGGQIYRRMPAGFRRDAATVYGIAAPDAVRLHRAFDDLAGRIDYRPGTLVWAAEPGLLSTYDGDRHRPVPFQRLILATGATDRMLPIPGWTRCGVFTLGGAQVALKHQGCAIGARVAFVGTGPLLYLVAYQYARAGIRVAAVLDTARLADAVAALPGLAANPKLLAAGFRYRAWLHAHGIAVRNGTRPLAVEGDGGGAVAAIRWRDARGREHMTEADSVALGFGLRSESQLAELLGVPFAWDASRRQWLPTRDADGRVGNGVYVAGDGAGIRGAQAAEEAGRLAALALLHDAGSAAAAVRDTDEMMRLRARLARRDRFATALLRAFPAPFDLLDGLPDATVLCRCEAVTIGAFRDATRRFGADEPNRAKAFSRVGMGRCQGRMCGIAAAELIARWSGRTAAAFGPLRAQAPVKPVPLLAAAGEADP